jgi:hypothetical protein
MTEQQELLLIQQTVSNFKATLRWLHKSRPELWEKILERTSFLPENTSAPQRAWHILNDVYEVQLCSVTGKPLGWICFEHGYKKYGDKKSRYDGVAKSIRETVDKDGHWRHNDPQKAIKANKKFSDGFSNGLHKPWDERNRNYQEITKRSQETCLEKYGVDNYRKTKTMREMAAKLVYQRYLDAGGIPREQRSTRDAYYSEVWIHTNKSWYEHFYDINPGSLQRGNDYHLDHIYSVQQGFTNNVPPEIIGHWTNLRLIDARKNKSKRNKCDKSIEQLYEDYEHHQNT